LKGIAKKALPVVGGALGSFIPIPGVGTALGAAAGNLAARALEAELEGLTQEDREFEVAKRFVQVAGKTAVNGARRPNVRNPQAAVIAALRRALAKMRRARGMRRPQRRPSRRMPGAPSSAARSAGGGMGDDAMGAGGNGDADADSMDQPAPGLSGLPEQSGFPGCIDDVHDHCKSCQILASDEGFAGIRRHADRRGIDQYRPRQVLDLGKRMPGFVWMMEGSGGPDTGNTLPLILSAPWAGSRRSLHIVGQFARETTQQRIGIVNRGAAPYTIEPGERICQMLFVPVTQVALEIVPEFSRKIDLILCVSDIVDKQISKFNTISETDPMMRIGNDPFYDGFSPNLGSL
jgi:hypothetical protein